MSDQRPKVVRIRKERDRKILSEALEILRRLGLPKKTNIIKFSK